MRVRTCFIFLLSSAAVLLPSAACFAMETGRPSKNDSAHRQLNERVEVMALKNNLLYDAILTPNLELEFRLTDRWTLELGAGFNPFPLDDTKFPKWRHVSAHIAPRYWFCHAFNRDFLSFNLAYAHYNVAGDTLGGGKYPIGWLYPQILTHRYQGDAIMAGLSYGWHFAISPHFSIELEAGIEGGYTWFEEFECRHCGASLKKSGHFFALPKAGVNLVVPLGGNEESLARRCDCEKMEEKPQDTVVVAPVDTTPVVAVVDTVPEEPLPEFIAARRIPAVIAKPVKPVIAFVPVFNVQGDKMGRLRSRILRDESEYEPYDINTALSADPRNTFIYFEVDVAKLDRSFLQNDKLMDSIIYIIGDALADPTIRITRVQIVGFASFDGRLNYNIGLAGSRAQTIKEYIRSTFHLDDSLFTVCNGGESWAELRYRLQQVDFLGRDEVLDIIDTEPDLEAREKQIKALHGGKTYIYMRDELKRILRNLGCITVYVETIE